MWVDAARELPVGLTVRFAIVDETEELVMVELGKQIGEPVR